MSQDTPDVTLGTVHEDLVVGFAGLKGEIREVKATLVVGFRGLASRESSEEMVKLLREGNRLNEERFTQLDVRIREQQLETQQGLHALVQGQHRLVESHALLAEDQRALSTEVRGLSVDIKALVAHIDALIRGRSNGEPPA